MSRSDTPEERPEPDQCPGCAATQLHLRFDGETLSYECAGCGCVFGTDAVVAVNAVRRRYASSERPHITNAAPQVSSAGCAHRSESTTADREPAAAAPEIERLRRFAEAFKAAYPNIRQLQDGFATDVACWSAWDEEVRQETIRLGKMAFGEEWK